MTPLDYARGELGVREDLSSNEDKAGRIAEYRTAVRDSRYTMIPGDAYCAAFVSWCLEQAGEPLTHRAGSGMSYVPWMKEFFVQDDSWIEEDPPEVGDIVIFALNGGRPNHVGFVEAVSPDSITTIEGNVGTYPNGGVKRMKRVWGEKILGFGAMS